MRYKSLDIRGTVKVYGFSRNPHWFPFLFTNTPQPSVCGFVWILVTATKPTRDRDNPSGGLEHEMIIKKKYLSFCDFFHYEIISNFTSIDDISAKSKPEFIQLILFAFLPWQLYFSWLIKPTILNYIPFELGRRQDASN